MTRFIIKHFSTLPSTNDTAKDYRTHGTVILADEQTSGKGRRGKYWHSPKGNLFCSLVLSKPNLEHIGIYSLAAALAVAKAIDSPQVSLKWPNDILLSGKKVAGVLLELTERPSRLIIGTGVNLTSFPPATGLNYAATSLAKEHIHTSPEVFLKKYLESLDNLLSLKPAEILAKWQDLAAGIGNPIKVMLAKTPLLGVFKGLDTHGNLILSPKNKTEPDKIITAGEIFLN